MLFWRAYSRAYDSLWNNELHLEVSAAVAELLDPTLPVIEVGAGTGLTTERLFAAGFLVEPSEPDPAMRKRFLERLPEIPVGTHGAEEAFGDGRPKNVVAVNVLHLVADPASTLHHLQRVAGPDGTVVVVTPQERASIASTTLALRRSGSSLGAVARFLSLQLALVPLTALGGPRRRQLDIGSAIFRTEVGGVQQLSAFRGMAPIAEDRSPRRQCSHLAAAMLAVLALVAGCSSGPERSTESFCNTLKSEQERILDQFEEVSSAAGEGDGLSQVLLGVGGSIQALGELRTYFDKLSKVAPTSIQSEMEIIAEQYDEQFDDIAAAADNPLAGLVGGIIDSIAISGQMNTVNQFALDNCGQSL
jgi:hypothetical protein